MPNWCFNDIRVSGPSDELDAFLTAAQGVPEGGTEVCPLVLERLLSIPPEMRAGDCWYDWCIHNWGTKWDLNHVSFDDPSPDLRVELPEGLREVRVTCDSAWSPPIPALRSISGLFPALTFTIEYDEPGMDFAGAATFRAGQGGGGRGRSRILQQHLEDKHLEVDDSDPDNEDDDGDFDNGDGGDIVFTFAVRASDRLTSAPGLLAAVRDAFSLLMPRKSG